MSSPKPHDEQPDPQTFTPAPQRVANVLVRLRVLVASAANSHAAKMSDLLTPHVPGLCGHHVTEADRLEGRTRETVGRWYECMACLYAWAYYATIQPTQHGLERGRSKTRPRPTETVVVAKVPQRADVRKAAADIVDAWRLGSEGRWRPAFSALQAAESKLIRGPGRGRVKEAGSRLEGGDSLHPRTIAELHRIKRERQRRGEDFGEADLPVAAE